MTKKRRFKQSRGEGWHAAGMKLMFTRNHASIKVDILAAVGIIVKNFTNENTRKNDRPAFIIL